MDLFRQLNDLGSKAWLNGIAHDVVALKFARQAAANPRNEADFVATVQHLLICSHIPMALAHNTLGGLDRGRPG